MGFDDKLRLGDFGKNLTPKDTSTQSCSEITVTVKDEEKTLKTKFLVYDKYEVNDNDPVIKDCVAKSLKDFGSDPGKIKIRINLEIL